MTTWCSSSRIRSTGFLPTFLSRQWRSHEEPLFDADEKQQEQQNEEQAPSTSANDKSLVMTPEKEVDELPEATVVPVVQVLVMKLRFHGTRC
jgi:hypothetical protein